MLAIDHCVKISNNAKESSEKNKAYYHGFIVTNGYLLTPSNAERLRDSGITHAQVTIDGDREKHNQQRMLKNASGPSSWTYDRVLSNVIACKDIISIQVRINVDKSASPDLSELTGILHENKILYSISPVKWRICNKAGNTLENREHCVSLDPEATLKAEALSARIAGCAATDLFSLTVCPDGTLLRCWEEVGKPVSYGNILAHISHTPRFQAEFR